MIIFYFAPFLKLNVSWLIFIRWREARQRQGYSALHQQEYQEEIEEKISESNVTILESIIFLLTMLQVGLGCALGIIGYLADVSWDVLGHNAIFFSGWIMQLLILFSALPRFSLAPRYYFIAYVLVISPQAYLIFVSKPLDDLIYTILMQVSLGVTILLGLCDLFKPARYAYIINSTKINGRFPSAESTASSYSLLTFSWVNNLLAIGYDHPLESEDMPHLSNEDKMKSIVEKWSTFRNPHHSVVWNAVLFTKKFAIWQITLAVLSTILDFAKPFFINQLLVWIQTKSPDENINHGLFLLAGMFVSALVREILYGQIYLSGRHWGIQLRSIFVFEIFRKSLRRTGGAALADEDAGTKASQGKIVSLMSSDINTLRFFLTDIHSLMIDTPLSTFLSITGLLYLMGPSALAGLLVIIVSGPVSSWALTRLYKLLKATRTFCDRRIQITNEALLSIRIIKYMAWETKFAAKMNSAREDELNSRFDLLKSNLILTCITWGSSILVTFISFFFYTVVAGNNLDAATAFTAISLLSTLSFVLNDISQTVSQVLNIRVILGRINTFLAEQELDKFNGDIPPENLDKNTYIGFKDADFGYYGSTTEESSGQNLSSHATASAEHDATTFKLRNISIVFPKSRLTAIVGPTGSGKTSLLLTLLGEMKKFKGEYSISEYHLRPNAPPKEKSDIAYVAQTAWLMNATIKNNIIFGEEYDEQRYFQVVKSCALMRDLDTLEYGDLTVETFS
jgi:ABC-type multidrug transport system fused ATPase/permease subunit